MQPHNFGRANSYHNTKRQLLGSQAGRPAPAWRTNQETMRNKAATEQGSKILLSRLPADVSDEEVEVSTRILSTYETTRFQYHLHPRRLSSPKLWGP